FWLVIRCWLIIPENPQHNPPAAVLSIPFCKFVIEILLYQNSKASCSIIIAERMGVMSVKEFILKELEKNRDQFLSGEELAQKAQVTRAAVWKAMKELKEEGYKIESKRKTGYRLLLENDLISPQGISSYLKQDLKKLDIFSYKTIDSTNE